MLLYKISEKNLRVMNLFSKSIFLNESIVTNQASKFAHY